MSHKGPPGLESRYAWMIVVVSSVLMGMGAGALVSISVFLKPLIADVRQKEPGSTISRWHFC
ncbi:MAG: hypothetical protein ACE5H7_00590 [Acidiferrobacterales bacterium]